MKISNKKQNARLPYFGLKGKVHPVYIIYMDWGLRGGKTGRPKTTWRRTIGRKFVAVRALATNRSGWKKY